MTSPSITVVGVDCEPSPFNSCRNSSFSAMFFSVKLHAALRQKLRLLVAGLSHGLRVDHHVDLGHAHLLSSFAALRSNSRLGIVTAITPTASVGPWAAHFTARFDMGICPSGVPGIYRTVALRGTWGGATMTLGSLSLGEGKKEESMRAMQCVCRRHLEAQDDRALLASLREHLAAEHFGGSV
jgi:hypothetical protein